MHFFLETIWSETTVKIEGDEHGDITVFVTSLSESGGRMEFGCQPLNFSKEEHGLAQFGLWLEKVKADFEPHDLAAVRSAFGLTATRLAELVAEMDADEDDLAYVADDDVIRFYGDGEPDDHLVSHADLPVDVPSTLWGRVRKAFKACIARS